MSASLLQFTFTYVPYNSQLVTGCVKSNELKNSRKGDLRTAIDMARVCTPPSASTTFAAINPPYDCQCLINKKKSPDYILTHPQIPIRLLST
jgi:hypothetical protein